MFVICVIESGTGLARIANVNQSARLSGSCATAQRECPFPREIACWFDFASKDRGGGLSDRRQVEQLLRIKAEYDSTGVFKGVVYASLRQNLAVSSALRT